MRALLVVVLARPGGIRGGGVVVSDGCKKGGNDVDGGGKRPSYRPDARPDYLHYLEQPEKHVFNFLNILNERPTFNWLCGASMVLSRQQATSWRRVTTKRYLSAIIQHSFPKY